MARLARVVVPGWPHHITQRGNRRQQTFFSDADYMLYLRIAAEFFAKAQTEVWGYCLMPNHVHIIAVPQTKDGLRAAIAETHRSYTRIINRRERWTGYLWQGRFASFPMDGGYFVSCSRYVGLNPVRARLTAHARDWPWSSVNAHLRGADDALVRVTPLLERVGRADTFF
ncbi:MAG TPA: transposase, partial [Hyphomicrobiaceae bacterium]|nr:transposase [Hyphomicrobiaceae bacterium]